MALFGKPYFGSLRRPMLRGVSTVSVFELTTSTGGIAVSASQITQTGATITWTMPETSTWTISTQYGTVLTGSGTSGQAIAQPLNFPHTGTSYTLSISTPHYTGTVTVTTLAYVPGQPAVSSHSQTANSLTIVWGAVANATSYNIMWSVAGAASWQGSDTTTGTSYTIPNLNPGTLYSIGIQAVAPDVI